MTKSRSLVTAVSAGMLALTVSGAAIASSGGGSGGGGGFGSMPSMSAPAYDPVQEYQHAVQFLQDGKYKDAERALNHVLDSAPKEPNTLYMMGLAKAGENDPKAALRFFERTVKADPDHIGGRRQLALTEAKLGQGDKAKSDLASLKARADTCGGTCPDAGQLKAAVTEVEAAVTTPAAGAPTSSGPAAAVTPSSLMFAAPDRGDQAYLSAVRLINLHRYDAALDELKAAQIAFGPHPDILTYMGYVNRKLGRLDAAEQFYHEVFALAPNHVGATEYYGELKVERGDIAGAKLMLAKLETVCTYGCVEENDLRRWIAAGREP
jgi:tetratricopeptide (TPR) repeat protein